jgi:hypothetical protein
MKEKQAAQKAQDKAAQKTSKKAGPKKGPKWYKSTYLNITKFIIQLIIYNLRYLIFSSINIYSIIIIQTILNKTHIFLATNF